MRESKVLNKLKNGGYALSTQLASGYAPFAGIAAQTGFDCVWIDMEHKHMSQEQMRECILACTVYDCDTVVRIRKRGYLDYFRPLEDGATGIMVPHCKSVEEAKLAVYNSKFYPVGRRGVDFTGLSSDYMMASADDCVENALNNSMTIVQIEDVEALECVNEIAEVEGIDMLFIGPSDLKQSAMSFGVYNDNFMSDVYKKVNDAVKDKKDIWWGTVCATPDAAKQMYDLGCRFLNIRGDFGAVHTQFTKVARNAITLLG